MTEDEECYMDTCSVCGCEINIYEGMLNTEEHGIIHAGCEPCEEDE